MDAYLVKKQDDLFQNVATMLEPEEKKERVSIA